MLNGKSKVYNDLTGLSTVDWKRDMYVESTRKGCICVYNFAMSLSKSFTGVARVFSIFWATVVELIVKLEREMFDKGNAIGVTAFRSLMCSWRNQNSK